MLPAGSRPEAEKKCDGPWASDYRGTFKEKKAKVAAEQKKAEAGVACVENLTLMGKQLSQLKPETDPKLALSTVDRVNKLIEAATPVCRDADLDKMVKSLNETKAKMEVAAAHHRERKAKESFPEDSEYIKNKLADSRSKARQRKWRDSDALLRVCESTLDSFKGTSIVETAAWKKLRPVR